MCDSFVNQLSHDEKLDLSELHKNASKEVSEDPAKTPQHAAKLKYFMEKYDAYFFEALEGKFGPTAQMWTSYIYMINRIYRKLMQFVRTNNVDGYIALLPSVIALFFGLNRPNYARWGIMFLNQLRKAPPSCIEILKGGAFSVRRTSKNYSRTPVDICLEQTVNRDAASTSRGIVAYHNSEGAIQRWVNGLHQRARGTGKLRDITQMEATEHPALQVRNARIIRDNDHLSQICEVVKKNCNPFSEPAISSKLVNIATSKVASPITEKYITETLKVGQEMQVKFQNEYSEDPAKFNARQMRRPVKNFASENMKRGTKRVDMKKEKAQNLRDAFSRLVVDISLNHGVDLEAILSYPITNFPLSIAHSDGSALTTDKALLLPLLEDYQKCLTPGKLPTISATIIDGGNLLHSVLSKMTKCATYGEIARTLLSSVSKQRGRSIHVLFDTYSKSSLKYAERQRRLQEESVYVITGSEQSPRASPSMLLKNSSFKNELGRFLVEEWRKDHYFPYTGNKEIFVSYGGDCTRFYHDGNEGVAFEKPNEFQGQHEEADTLIIFHASQIEGNIMIRSTDTDVLVLLIGMIGKHAMTEASTPYNGIILDFGQDNRRRMVDVSELAMTLDAINSGLPAAIPSFHAVTGTDFTSSFYGKAKLKPWNVLLDNPEYI